MEYAKKGEIASVPVKCHLEERHPIAPHRTLRAVPLIAEPSTWPDNVTSLAPSEPLKASVPV